MKGALLGRVNGIVDGGISGDEDHRRVRDQGMQPLHQFDTVGALQMDIHHQDVRRRLAEPPHGLGGIDKPFGLIPVTLQGMNQTADGNHLVIKNNYSWLLVVVGFHGSVRKLRRRITTACFMVKNAKPAPARNGQNADSHYL